MWLYRSTVDMVGHANAGLVGPILVTRAGQALPDGRPSDLDREFITLFQVRAPLSLALRDESHLLYGMTGGFQ